MELKNKIALITGGARIGDIVAEELAKAGCHVVLVYRHSKQEAHQTLKKIFKFKRQGLAVRADLSHENDVKKLVEKVKRTFGKLHFLVNMASDYYAIPWQNISFRVWDQMLKSNLTSAFLTSKYAAPLMVGEGGRIVNIADWTAASGRPRYQGYLPYYVGKTGIIGLTQQLALELAPRILVNAIAPGPILPPKNMTKTANRNIKLATPLKKWGGPAEIARTVIFLLATDFITGECVRVDGGRHLF